MTYSDPNRLDRIEALVESNSRQLTQLSQTTQFLTTSQLELARSMDVLIRRVDRVDEQVSHLTQSQQVLIESQRSLVQSMERLTVVQEQLAEQQVSSNAAVERLDRILDYLIRRDGER